MKFVVDAQLPKTLSELLCKYGHDAIHTLDLPQRNRTDDNSIISLAIEEGRVVISKDNDFLRSYLLVRKPPQLLLVNTGNIKNNRLLKLFADNIDLLIGLFTTNDLIELTRESVIVHA